MYVSRSVTENEQCCIFIWVFFYLLYTKHFYCFYKVRGCVVNLVGHGSVFVCQWVMGHCLWPTVYSEPHSGLCTNSVRTACPAQAWVVRRLTAWYLPRSRRRKTHVCIQRLVDILQRQRQTEDLCFHLSLHSHWFLFSRSSWLPHLYISSDDKLFYKILTWPNQILRTLLPPPDRISRITDCNFTVWMMFRKMYWLLYILALHFVLFLCTTAVWQFVINELC